MSLASCRPSKERHLRIWRRRLEGFPDMRCFLPAGRKSTFPVAVILNRFFADLLVLSFGIFFSVLPGPGYPSFGRGLGGRALRREKGRVRRAHLTSARRLG